MVTTHSVRVGVLCMAVAVLVGCGSSGGGSGDKVTLSNMNAFVSGDAALQNLCLLDGFAQAYTYIATYSGNLQVGDRAFETLTFLPSGVSNVSDYTLGAAAPGSGIGPNEVGSTGCFTGGGFDTQIRIAFYVVTSSGERSNTVSDTFNI